MNISTPYRNNSFYKLTIYFSYNTNFPYARNTVCTIQSSPPVSIANAICTLIIYANVRAVWIIFPVIIQCLCNAIIGNHCFTRKVNTLNCYICAVIQIFSITNFVANCIHKHCMEFAAFGIGIAFNCNSSCCGFATNHLCRIDQFLIFYCNVIFICGIFISNTTFTIFCARKNFFCFTLCRNSYFYNTYNTIYRSQIKFFSPSARE